jgi:hypothetical protein
VAAVIVVALLAAACSSSGGDASTDGSTNPNGGGAPASDPVAGGAVPAGFMPSSVTFVSEDQGFVLGAYRCATPSATDASGGTTCPSLAATDDGGRTWHHLPAPAAPLHSPDEAEATDGVSRLRFADNLNGWAFGPGAWATHDGGETWTEQTFDGDVTDLASADGVTYALVTHCDSGPCGQGATLYRTDASTDDWQPIEGVTLTSTGGHISLHARAVWIVGESDGAGQSLLSASADGTTWTTRPNLCGADASLAAVAPVSTVDLFLLCADSPGAGSEGKRVLRSSDAGATAQPLTTMPPPSGIASALAAADPHVIAITATSGANWIYRTGDTGATWTTPLMADDSQTFSELGFTTATQGVVIRGRLDAADVTGPELLMTYDAGQTWNPVSFS